MDGSKSSKTLLIQIASKTFTLLLNFLVNGPHKTALGIFEILIERLWNFVAVERNRVKFGTLGTNRIYVWGTFDLAAFKVIWELFGGLAIFGIRFSKRCLFYMYTYESFSPNFFMCFL